MSFETYTYLDELQAWRLRQLGSSSQHGGPSDPRSPCRRCGG